jgi:hypothetical protein
MADNCGGICDYSAMIVIVVFNDDMIAIVVVIVTMVFFAHQATGQTGQPGDPHAGNETDEHPIADIRFLRRHNGS